MPRRASIVGRTRAKSWITSASRFFSSSAAPFSTWSSRRERRIRLERVMRAGPARGHGPLRRAPLPRAAVRALRAARGRGAADPRAAARSSSRQPLLEGLADRAPRAALVHELALELVGEAQRAAVGRREAGLADDGHHHAGLAAAGVDRVELVGPAAMLGAPCGRRRCRRSSAARATAARRSAGTRRAGAARATARAGPR